MPPEQLIVTLRVVYTGRIPDLHELRESGVHSLKEYISILIDDELKMFIQDTEEIVVVSVQRKKEEPAP